MKRFLLLCACAVAGIAAPPAQPAQAAAPSFWYCVDTLYGRAGLSHGQSDHEVRWMRNRLERQLNIDINDNSVVSSEVHGNGRAVSIAYFKLNGVWVGSKWFWCSNDPDGYHDWPSGFSRYGWYN